MSELQCISPIDNSLLLSRDWNTKEDIESKLEQSQKAQQDWNSISLSERKIILSKSLDYFRENKKALALEITKQMGRPICYAEGEINGFIERAEYMISVAEEALQVVRPSKVEGFTREIHREALGVVVVISPWNYPYLTSVNSIIPALLAGNSVVLKPSSQTPLIAEAYAKAFQSAAMPEGVFQYLFLEHPETEILVKKSAVSHVVFTGSVDGGRALEKSLAGTFKGLALELGGKDCAYVREDAFLEGAVETLIDGAFFNSGQSCCGIERIYVHESLFEAFVTKAVALVKQYKIGNPLELDTTLGPMVRPSSARFVLEQVLDAEAKGAQLHLPETMVAETSAYLPPQLLTNVNHSMAIMKEETFGPVVGIMKVVSDEEALQYMNDSEYGLTASVFSQDEAKVRFLASKLECGTVFQNRCDYLDPALAWSGVKNSGKGHALSILGFDSLTRPKSYHFKKV